MKYSIYLYNGCKEQKLNIFSVSKNVIYVFILVKSLNLKSFDVSQIKIEQTALT